MVVSMKRCGLLFLGLLLLQPWACGWANGQPLTLEECHRIIDTAYPLSHQVTLISQAAEAHRKSLLLAYVPQLSLGGKASYQSEVTSLDLDLSSYGFEVPKPRKDQYGLYGQVNQIVWDGGATGARGRIVQAEGRVGISQVREQLDGVHEQTEKLYFALLLLDERLKRHGLLEQALARQLLRVEACVSSGVANGIDVQRVEIQMHRAKQGRIEMETARKQLAGSLGELLKLDLTGRALQMPTLPARGAALDLTQHPSVVLIKNRVSLVDEQLRALTSKIYPHAFIFFQGGWGNPALNMLKDAFEWYYVVGLKVEWNFGSLYDYAEQRRTLQLRKSIELLSQDAVLRKLTAEQAGHERAAGGYEALLAEDEAMIAMHSTIVKNLESRVELGTASTSELLDAIDEQQQAEQLRVEHQVQQLEAYYACDKIYRTKDAK